MDGFPTKGGKKEHIPIYVREVVKLRTKLMCCTISRENAAGLTN